LHPPKLPDPGRLLESILQLLLALAGTIRKIFNKILDKIESKYYDNNHKPKIKIGYLSPDFTSKHPLDKVLNSHLRE